MKIKSKYTYRHLLNCILCILCFLLMSTTCDYEDDPYDFVTDEIVVINESSEPIFTICIIFQSGLSEPKSWFPDRFKDLIEIQPEESSIVYTNNRYDFYVAEGLYKCHAQILIFKQSTLDKYSYEEIIEKNIFDKRIIMSYDDLWANDFKVVYNDL